MDVTTPVLTPSGGPSGTDCICVYEECAYHSVPGKRPCTAFQGATVAASIQTYGILILSKCPCRPKLRVMFKRPWALTQDTYTVALWSCSAEHRYDYNQCIFYLNTIVIFFQRDVISWMKGWLAIAIGACILCLTHFLLELL